MFLGRKLYFLQLIVSSFYVFEVFRPKKRTNTQKSFLFFARRMFTVIPSASSWRSYCRENLNETRSAMKIYIYVEPVQTACTIMGSSQNRVFTVCLGRKYEYLDLNTYQMRRGEGRSMFILLKKFKHTLTLLPWVKGYNSACIPSFNY